MSTTSSSWVPGWVDPRCRVSHGKKELVDKRQDVEGVLVQAEQAVEQGVPGSEVFGVLVNEIAYANLSDCEVNLMERLLRTFHVDLGTTYDVFYQQPFTLLDEVIAAEKTTSRVETSFAIDRVRDHIAFQYPTQLHQVFPRMLATI